MSTGIAPADWPTNMSSEDRRQYICEQIRLFVGNQRLDAMLKAAELGQLSMLQKAVAYRNGLIISSIRHCRLHPRAEARIPILTVVTFLSDNSDGICYLAITRMMELFNRSRQCIIDNINGLEHDGLMGVSRKDGMPSCYWPLIPGALSEMNPNPVWFIEALTSTPKARIFGSAEDAIAAATHRSSPLDRSSRVDPTGLVQQGNRSSSAEEPVKSNTDSISSLNLTEEREGANAPTPADAGSSNLNGHSHQKTGQASSKPQRTPRAAQTRLPADWSLPDDWRRWALDNFGVAPKQVQLEADKFLDYWPNQYGPKAAKADWFATWRNWCRSAFGAKAAKVTVTNVPDPEAARVQREYNEALARRRAEDEEDAAC